MEYINDKNELMLYKDKMIALLHSMESNNQFSNFSFCCIDSGFYKIDYIFSDCLITSSRNSQNTPINGGVMYTDTAEIVRAKGNFDNLFDKCYIGKAEEYCNLREFIKNIF